MRRSSLAPHANDGHRARNDAGHRFHASLPPWLVAELAELPTTLPTAEDRMRLVNELADLNWREGNGGPFAALVVDHASGELVSTGVNVVLSSAEVTALTLAQVAVGPWDLGTGRDLELVVNWRPCVTSRSRVPSPNANGSPGSTRSR